MSEILSIAGWTVLWAALSTVLVMIVGVPLAYLLARKQFFGKRLLSSLVSLPLVLPPTAVGYLLLRALADNGPLGQEILGFDLGILLTWKAVVIACSIMSIPLVVRTARVSFEEVDPRLEDMARTFGRGTCRTFFTVTLPLAARGLIAAMILGFTRALGEFGATIIIAGNIRGETRTLSSAIYSAQQAGEQGQADVLTCLALLIGFIAVFATETLSRPKKLRRSPSTSSQNSTELEAFSSS